MATTNNLHCFRGEAYSPRFTMAPVEDITGWTIVFTLKRKYSDAAALLTINASLTTPASGVFTVALTAAQTSALAAGQYVYDASRTNSGSEAVLSIGVFAVSPEARV